MPISSLLRPIDQQLFDQLTTAAAASPRRRLNHNFHATPTDPCQRFLNALLPDSYVRPHRHLECEETLLVLRGAIGVLLFDEAGGLTATVRLEAGGQVGMALAANVFHSLVVLGAPAVIFECKDGPYRPLVTEEWAAWAPQEGRAAAVDYLAWMRGQFAEVI
ncbi:WbuC family cupin fold metalloprotein [Chitinimonas lacunae]|uniref:WbuC family cupin fold metalloprotein n=1 Tax=Chitinimonas lacunae TaxID=1963018 RepID=A0ABV8MKE2_9NEIS